jgi:hypothetical protein
MIYAYSCHLNSAAPNFEPRRSGVGGTPRRTESSARILPLRSRAECHRCRSTGPEKCFFAKRTQQVIENTGEREK